MDSINLASVWYYYHKYQRGGYDHIRCKQKIWVDGIGHHCKWSIDKYFDVDKEKIEEKMQQHLEEVHPIKYEEQLAAQLQKEVLSDVAQLLVDPAIFSKLAKSLERYGQTSRTCRKLANIGHISSINLINFKNLELEW